MDVYQTPQKYKKNKNISQNLLSIPPSPFLEKLGYGTGVNVWKLNHSPTSGSIRSPWAIKNISKKVNAQSSMKYQTLINNEASILKSLDHENIIGFRGFLKSEDGRNCLAMEVGGESLGNLIEARQENNLGPCPPDIILKVGLKVAKALQYLHDVKHILHGDLKSFNVVIKNNFDEVKLCDFGVSLDLNDKDIAKKYVGTPIYSAPECQKNNQGPITAKCDIFSFGLMLWEMMSLCPPHLQDILDCDSFNETDLNESILDEGDSFFTCLDESTLEENYGTRPPLPSHDLGPEYTPIIEIFYSCTEQDPNRRPSASLLVQQLQSLQKT